LARHKNPPWERAWTGKEGSSCVKHMPVLKFNAFLEKKKKQFYLLPKE
jgi:hypothetical protein